MNDDLARPVEPSRAQSSPVEQTKRNPLGLPPEMPGSLKYLVITYSDVFKQVKMRFEQGKLSKKDVLALAAYALAGASLRDAMSHLGLHPWIRIAEDASERYNFDILDPVFASDKNIVREN